MLYATPISSKATHIEAFQACPELMLNIMQQYTQIKNCPKQRRDSFSLLTQSHI